MWNAWYALRSDRFIGWFGVACLAGRDGNDELAIWRADESVSPLRTEGPYDARGSASKGEEDF